MKAIYEVSIPASLARRLAESADGFRNVKEVFFVAAFKFPHQIKEFFDLAAAEAYLSEKNKTGKKYGIFGPYTTNDEVKNLKFRGVEDIARVDLKIHFKNGDHQTVSLKGSIDSIFFNLSSFEKFVFPYYCQVFGVEYAKNMRDKLIDQYAKYKKDGGEGFVPFASEGKDGNGVSGSLSPLKTHINLTYMLTLDS